MIDVREGENVEIEEEIDLWDKSVEELILELQTLCEKYPNKDLIVDNDSALFFHHTNKLTEEEKEEQVRKDKEERIRSLQNNLVYYRQTIADYEEQLRELEDGN